MIENIYQLSFMAMLALFVIFLVIVFKGPGKVEGRREKSPGPVRLGALLQSMSYMFAWAFRRQEIPPFGSQALWPLIAVSVLSLASAVGAIILVKAAKRHLGRQWALGARIVEGHELVSDGPFAVVRHPIYFAMGLLLLAPIIGFSSWPGTLLSLLMFAAGTVLRVRAEEAVLIETFGSRYEDYRRRVPAFLPRLKRR
jgi:protein-S-isoprenylcysteine O-methyltransferase Ste14